MRTDHYYLEWEMNRRVTSAHDQGQRDRLARLCSEAQKAELACRRMRGDLCTGKPVGLVRQLGAAVGEVLRPLWGNSLQNTRRG